MKKLIFAFGLLALTFTFGFSTQAKTLTSIPLMSTGQGVYTGTLITPRVLVTTVQLITDREKGGLRLFDGGESTHVVLHEKLKDWEPGAPVPQAYDIAFVILTPSKGDRPTAKILTGDSEDADLDSFFVASSRNGITTVNKETIEEEIKDENDELTYVLTSNEGGLKDDDWGAALFSNDGQLIGVMRGGSEERLGFFVVGSKVGLEVQERAEALFPEAFKAPKASQLAQLQPTVQQTATLPPPPSVFGPSGVGVQTQIPAASLPPAPGKAPTTGVLSPRKPRVTIPFPPAGKAGTFVPVPTHGTTADKTQPPPRPSRVTIRIPEEVMQNPGQASDNRDPQPTTQANRPSAATPARTNLPTTPPPQVNTTPPTVPPPPQVNTTPPTVPPSPLATTPPPSFKIRRSSKQLSFPLSTVQLFEYDPNGKKAADPVSMNALKSNHIYYFKAQLYWLATDEKGTLDTRFLGLNSEAPGTAFGLTGENANKLFVLSNGDWRLKTTTTGRPGYP